MATTRRKGTSQQRIMNFNDQDWSGGVTLSAAKGLARWAQRCFAALSMTFPVLVGKTHRARLFQSSTLTAIFGPGVATMVTRIIIMLTVIGTLIIIIAGLLRPNASQSSTNSITSIGAIAPTFTLTTPGGKQISLSNFYGKPVMLNFWYATCPGCLAEIPGMQKFYAAQHAAGKDFVILGVNVVDDAPAALQFVQQYGLTYPVVLDQSQRIMALYNVNSTPTSYFIDRQGVIRSIANGPIEDTVLQQDVAQISS